MIAMLRTAFTSLRVRLILLTLAVLVPAHGLLVYVAHPEREIGHGEEKARMLYLARLAAAEESQVVQSTRQLLRTLAETPEARGETTIEKAGSRMKRPIEAALVGAKRFVFRRKMGSKIDDVESRLRG